MSLEMRDRRGRCGGDLGRGDPASVCSHECTSCEGCAAEMGRISNEELDGLLQGLPYWGLVKMKATPLQDIEGRRERDLQGAEQIEQSLQR